MTIWLTRKQLRSVAQLCQTSAGLVWIQVWDITCSDKRWGSVCLCSYYITSIAQQGSAELYSNSESSLMISDHTHLPWNGADWSFVQNGIYKLTDMGFLFACVMKVEVTLLQLVQRLNSRINYLKWWVLYFLLSPGQELIFFFPEGNAFIRDKLQDFIQSSWGEL